MRFKDGKNNFYVIREGEWVHNGTKLVQATPALTSILLRPENGLVLVTEQVFVLSDNPATPATQATAVTQAIIGVTYVDEGTEGLVVYTTPGPNEECCDLVSQGLIAVCATKTEVTVT